MSSYSGQRTKSPQPLQTLATPSFTPLAIADQCEVARPAPKMIPTPQLLERLKILPTSETVSKNSAMISMASNPKSPPNEYTFGPSKKSGETSNFTAQTQMNKMQTNLSTKFSYLDSYSNHQSRQKYNHPNLCSYFENKMVQHE